MGDTLANNNKHNRGGALWFQPPFTLSSFPGSTILVTLFLSASMRARASICPVIRRRRTTKRPVGSLSRAAWLNRRALPMQKLRLSWKVQANPSGMLCEWSSMSILKELSAMARLRLYARKYLVATAPLLIPCQSRHCYAPPHLLRLKSPPVQWPQKLVLAPVFQLRGSRPELFFYQRCRR